MVVRSPAWLAALAVLLAVLLGSGLAGPLAAAAAEPCAGHAAMAPQSDAAGAPARPSDCCGHEGCIGCQAGDLSVLSIEPPPVVSLRRRRSAGRPCPSAVAAWRRIRRATARAPPGEG
ncbi:MAG TPA: hypothetical protein VJL84_05230 [Kiloniellales bacterium]|nr:hypothetical protein [Kiloniellales bacterium]